MTLDQFKSILTPVKEANREGFNKLEAALSRLIELSSGDGVDDKMIKDAVRVLMRLQYDCYAPDLSRLERRVIRILDACDCECAYEVEEEFESFRMNM